MTEPKDYSLILQCLHGDTRAFGTIVERYQKVIFNTVLRMVKDPQDAEDITQAVFVKAYENLRSYKAKHKFFSWIYRMAINEALNFLNFNTRFEELSPNHMAEEKTPDQDYEDAEVSGRVQEALMDLDIDHRAVIVLKHFQELSYRDIGYVLDLPEKTVKSRLFTARRRLADILARKGLGASG
jgi:RNA polymerase sigma-70 factor (ECF subfamily)